MPIIVAAAKGGAGATVVAHALGSAAAHTTLVDLTGDLTAAIGTDPGPGPGVADWAASDAPTGRLDELLLPVRGGHLAPWTTSVAPSFEDPLDGPRRWSLLVEWCTERERRTSGTVVLDVGSRPETAERLETGHRMGWQTVLVTRACYLSIAAARQRAAPPDLVVVVRERGRALTPTDIRRATGAATVLEVAWDPGIARAVDAGLGSCPTPPVLRRLGAALSRSLSLPATNVA